MKTIGIVLLALLTGYAAAVFVDMGSLTEGASPEAGSQLDGLSAKDIESRLRQIETKLDREIADRQRLEASLERLLDGEAAPFLSGGGPARAGVESAEASELADAGADSRETGRRSDRARIERLQESGFPASQAAWIVQRESEIRLSTLYDRWQERREAVLDDLASGELANQNPLRVEMGERDYERYLEANGRSTGVRIARLIDDSPAAMAGFRAGDEIVRYNRKRVYNLSDLNAASVQGELGEPVLVEVIRDGSRIQLSIERGPLGIVSRRRWR